MPPGTVAPRRAASHYAFGRFCKHSFFALLVFVGVLPLKDTRPASAAARYDHARHLFQAGYLALSEQEAESAAEEYQVSEPLWASRFVLLEADAMLYRGMYEDALRVLATYRGSKATDANTVEKLAIEAVALTRQQQLPAAEQRLAEAEALCNAKDYSSCGDVLAARALLSAKLGQFNDAREGFFHVLSFARSHHDPWLETSTTLNLGYIAMQVNHFDEAIDWSTSAYREATNSGFENSAQGAAGNLGWAYFQLGDVERALDQFQLAEQSASRLGSLRQELKWLSTAGYVYQDTGDLLRALDCYRKAFEFAKQLDSKDDIEIALEDLAWLSVANGDLRDAGAYIDQVAPMESAGGERLSPNLMLTKGMLATAVHQDAEAETDYRSVWNNHANLTTLRLYAGSGLGTLYKSHGHPAAAEQMYKSTLAVYESARATLRKEETQLPFGANATQVYDDYIDLLVGQKRTGEALAIADRSRARSLEQGLDTKAGRKSFRDRAMDPRRIAQTADATLLFYWLGDKQSYLWAITPARIAMFPLPPQQQISARVESYRNAILRLQDPRVTGNRDGQWLYSALVAPANVLIRPGKRVIVFADGALSELNFDTLLVPPAGEHSDSSAATHYLLEDLTLVSAPSLSMLSTPERPRDRGAGMLLLGNPVLSSQDFPSLPLFGFEMSRIESHFGKDQLSVFAGRQATPAAYFANHPAQYTFIHFVSHAIASRTDPLDSAIILSSSGADDGSFKLYARDIIKARIDARLVTISACYGSGTRLYAGEGLVGLSWAFLRAGAQRVIGALWEVSDASTPRLMDSLYLHLANGKSPETSLRAAKLDLLHAGGRFSLPFYWAAFQMYDRE